MQVPEEQNNASYQMALALLDKLQQTGQRDQIKEWFSEQLQSTNWTSQMFHQASDVTKHRLSQKKEKKEDDDDNEDEETNDENLNVLTANQLADELMKHAIDEFPKDIFTKLYDQLLPITRTFVSKEQLPNTKVIKPSDTPEEPP